MKASKFIFSMFGALMIFAVSIGYASHQPVIEKQEIHAISTNAP